MSSEPITGPPVRPAPTPSSYTWRQVRITNTDGSEYLAVALQLNTPSGMHMTFWSGEEATVMCREGLRVAKLTAVGHMDPTLADAISAASQPREEPTLGAALPDAEEGGAGGY